MITNFNNKEKPKEKAPWKCLSIIMLLLNSISKASENCYPQTVLEECKYVQEKMKIENYIDLEESESDSECNNETESDIDNDKHNE